MRRRFPVLVRIPVFLVMLAGALGMGWHLGELASPVSEATATEAPPPAAGPASAAPAPADLQVGWLIEAERDEPAPRMQARTRNPNINMDVAWLIEAEREEPALPVAAAVAPVLPAEDMVLPKPAGIEPRTAPPATLPRPVLLHLG